MESHKNILILFAHPAFHKSRVNKVLIEAIRNTEGIHIHNLYEEYPDFHIDVEREQELLLEHDIMVWHHPFYWYSGPAIIKEWIDLVLEHGFAYGRDGQALKGKSMCNTLTTGGRKEAYQQGGFNQYTIRQLLAPYERTVKLCYMNYYPPFVVHGSHLLEKKDIENYADQYKSVLLALRDDRFTVEQIMRYEYLNDLLIGNKMNL